MSDGASTASKLNKACRIHPTTKETAMRGNLREGFLSSLRAREEHPMTEVGRLPVWPRSRVREVVG